MIDCTFDFEFDLECDFIASERCCDRRLSIKEIFEQENNWESDVTVSKKKLLLRGKRDPNLAECQLESDLTHQHNVNDYTSVKSVKKEVILNEFETLSIKERNFYSYKILKQDKDGDNLLFIAIILGRTQLSLHLIDLISYHSRLNIYNNLYQTALHLASLTENYKIVRRLVIAGIEIEMQDKSGNTALHLACKMGSVEVAKALVTAVTYQETKRNTYEIPYQPIPQNLNIRNSDGLTCLHIAVIQNHKEVVELLLSKEVDINVIEMKAGKTCLHIAAESGCEKMVQLILSKSRPNLSQKTFAGYTATELAHYRGHDYIVYILRCKGALAARSIETIERKPGTNQLDRLYESDDSKEGDDYYEVKEDSDKEGDLITID